MKTSRNCQHHLWKCTEGRRWAEEHSLGEMDIFGTNSEPHSVIAGTLLPMPCGTFEMIGIAMMMVKKASGTGRCLEYQRACDGSPRRWWGEEWGRKNVWRHNIYSFSKLMENMSPPPGACWTPNEASSKRSTPDHSMMEGSEAGRRDPANSKREATRLATDFSSETTKASRQWDD